MREITVSVYNGGYNWAIARKEEKRKIYDRLMTWNKEKLSKEKVIKELTELGYERITICEDGDIEIYVNGNLEV